MQFNGDKRLRVCNTVRNFICSYFNHSLFHHLTPNVQHQRGKGQVDIRRFYNDHPTRKGVRLSERQWNKFTKTVSMLDSDLKTMQS